MKHHIIDGALQVTKIVSGGGVTAGATYAATTVTLQKTAEVLTITEIQAYATLAAAVFTGLYFLAAFVLTSIKVVKEVKGTNTGE